MVAADQNYFDLFLVQTLELFSYIRPRRIAWQDAIVEVASNEEQVRPIFKSKIDQHIKTVLKVALSLEPSRTILDCRGIEMVVGCEQHMDCHRPLIPERGVAHRYEGWILRLEMVEREPPEGFLL